MASKKHSILTHFTAEISTTRHKWLGYKRTEISKWSVTRSIALNMLGILFPLACNLNLAPSPCKHLLHDSVAQRLSELSVPCSSKRMSNNVLKLISVVHQAPLAHLRCSLAREHGRRAQGPQRPFQPHSDPISTEHKGWGEPWKEVVIWGNNNSIPIPILTVFQANDTSIYQELCSHICILTLTCSLIYSNIP